MENWSLNLKKGIVTGASKGIGLAISEELAFLGAELILVSRNESDIIGVADRLMTKGYKASPLAADISTVEGRHKIKDKVMSLWSNVDILVNNAGINIRNLTIETPLETTETIFRTNVLGTLELTKDLFPLLKSSGSSSIINIASIAGRLDAGTGAAYAMSKAAEIQLSRVLANEWAQYGIRINSVSPWFTETPLTSQILARPEMVQKIVQRTPIGRVARPAEIAGMVAFLAMDKSSFITGQDFSIDGGMTARAF